MKKIILVITALVAWGGEVTSGQTATANPQNIPVVSKAPVSYRVNVSGSKLHGYYKKGYDLTIYGDSSAIGFRADCDLDDDFSGANPGGTTQTSNSFESTFKCVFNPHDLYGTVLPGNNNGQKHYDRCNALGVRPGDLTITYKLDRNNTPIDSIVGVVFDRGPHNQPGESSVAVCKRFKTPLDNNQFVYIVFPNTARYVKQVIGIKADNRTLRRNPTNDDFKQAFTLMLQERDATGRTAMKHRLTELLTPITIVSNFDNATAKEKAEGKLKPKNNDRNLNE